MKKFLILTAFLQVLFWWTPMTAYAAGSWTIFGNANVTFSPDRKAWTTDAGKTNCVWYPEGTTVNTGIPSSLPALGKGQHYYAWARTGSVPVGRWTVEHGPAKCIHDSYPQTQTWHGVQFARASCRRSYYSGWLSYCADCGDILAPRFIYMGRSTAESLHYLEMQDDLEYYYICPFCNNLEQGASMGVHLCKEVSANQYRVVYSVNADQDYRGCMPDSLHMYNNASEYEGNTVTPVTRLTKNTYVRLGYEFAGWNTLPDGSGESYEDKAVILNLSAADWKDSDTWTDSDKGVVILYAQWEPSRSTLRIDPNGGRFQGKADVTELEGDYGSVYHVSAQDVTAPFGPAVSFETNGGSPLKPVRGTMHFVEWNRSVPFDGIFSDGTYFYLAAGGGQDTLTACYDPDPVTLPETVRAGYSFGGWYYDEKFTLPAGAAGDLIVPFSDVTLYAQWVDLTLSSRDNYAAHEGKGAVDLSWTQADNNNKTYAVYQSTDAKGWEKVNTANDIGNSRSVDVSFTYTGASSKYIVPYTGIYTLTAEGAQGAGYKNHSGGAGGMAEGRFWLRQGEVITCTVGGMNGYNGGGTSSAYGNGGGCTIFSSDQKGTLLIAGGGGGASLAGDGGAGGSAASLVSGRTGQSGMAGGGGGDLGGSAGQAIFHYHTGNPSNYGGCYTVSDRCTGKSFTEERKIVGTYNGCYYQDADGVWHHDGYCVQCGSYTCSWHNKYEYKYLCNACGAVYEGYRPKMCTKTSGYRVSCGYTDGQVISSYPAYGGSNYVNTAYAYSYEKQSGVRRGNGQGGVRSVQVGFVEELKLNGVSAKDLAAPDKVSDEVQMVSQGTRQVKLIWEEPKDNGTKYYHAVESFLAGSERPLCRSNITVNTLVSGVKGYYYLIDENPDTVVNAKNGRYTKERWGTVLFSSEPGKQLKYLHVASVDLADNVSVTTHIPVENTAVAWKLHTRRIEPESGDNVFYDGSAWYVKSDGVTPFTLRYNAWLEGMASDSYQPNYVIFEERTEESWGRNILFAPSGDDYEKKSVLKTEELTVFQEGEPLLQRYPYTLLERFNGNAELSATQKFFLEPELSGSLITVIPVAGADFEGSVVYSDHASDEKNGVLLIADGEAPLINGLELLNDRELIDRREGKLTLTVSAADELSGVREFYVKVVNKDNAIEKVYRPDEAGIVLIEITADEPVFSGDFDVTAFASDNVGNEVRISSGTTEFSLEAEIERILEPHDPIFKNGESGVLTVSVWGYADRVEVEFPQEMVRLDPELNKVFEYDDDPDYLHQEKIQFMVPLKTPANENYEIIVRAYKGDRRLEEHPEVSIVQINGTVLDQFRSRLR